MLIKSSIIGISPDGIYTIEKDTDRGIYYLKTNGKIADNEHAISFNAPSVETRLERWAEIYGVELNPEYLTNSKRHIKSVRDDRTGKEDYETKWEYVDELCDRAIESMGGDKDAMFFTQGLRDSDFAVKGHYIDIMEANGNYSFPNDLWADVCKSLGMEKLLRISEAKDRNNYTLFVDWTGNGLMNNRKPVQPSRRPIKSGWVYIFGTDKASVFKERDNYMVEYRNGSNYAEEYFDNEQDAKDFAVEISEDEIQSSRRPIKSSVQKKEESKHYNVLDNYGGTVGFDMTLEDANDLAEDIDGIVVPVESSFFVSKDLNGKTAFYCIDNRYHFENDMSRPEIKIFNNKSEAEKIAKRSKSGFAQEL